MVLCLLGAVTPGQSAGEYQVKAAFLFNFVKFVEWPVDAIPNEGPLSICVLGTDPFGHDLEQMVADKAVNGHRVEIVHPAGIPQARSCHVAFIGADEKQAAVFLHGLKGSNTLTVGDAPGFCRMGGVVGFVLVDGRVRFEINQKAAEQSHLKLSARLLTVAKAVVTGE
jgi:hypothetical protein